MASKHLAWGVTGAGHWLAESFDAITELKTRYNVLVTTFLSSAGREIVRMYGLWDRLCEISPGNYYEEILTSEQDGASSTKAGRLARGRYRVLIVSPATANTVAKIVSGIADTPVTNVVAQAQKGGTTIIVVPTDPVLGTLTTVIPVHLERVECRLCKVCPPSEICRYGAFTTEVFPRIDLLRCYGCEDCVMTCPYNAVKTKERIKVRTRQIDVRNVDELRTSKGFIVLDKPTEIIKVATTFLE